MGAIASYLRCVIEEADNRRYNFDRSKIVHKKFIGKLPVTRGQLEYEFKHLLGKLEIRNLELHVHLSKVKTVRLHPLFYRVNGDVEKWEVI